MAEFGRWCVYGVLLFLSTSVNAVLPTCLSVGCLGTPLNNSKGCFVSLADAKAYAYAEADERSNLPPFLGVAAVGPYDPTYTPYCSGLGKTYYDYKSCDRCTPCAEGFTADPLTGECLEDLEPCVEPWVGDPGACTCPAPYIEEGVQCLAPECTTEAPYLDAEVGIVPGVIGCNGGCAYVAVAGFVADPEGVPVESTQMKPTGESCIDLEPEPPPFVGTPDPEQCVYDALGNSICVDAGDGAPENCGSFNGEFVCIPSVPDDTCISTPGGSIMCVGSGAPDSGWNGTPDVPTPVPDPSFSWEGIPKPSGGWAPDGGPGSGSPPGQWWPPGADTGGRLWGPPLESPPGTDDTPATEPPDPDLAVADPMELVQEQDEPSGGPFGAITWGIPETGSCPAPSALEVLGQTIMVEYDAVCDAMELVRPFVIAIGAFMALGILMHFGR